MDVGVLGSGMVGRTLAGKIAETGQGVMIGTRDVGALLGREGENSFAAWHADHPAVKVGTFMEAARDGDIIFNATAGGVSNDAIQLAGEANLEGKILIDVANPLDFSAGFPPSLSVVNTDSLAEQIQRSLPRTRVVKALNTVNAAVMVEPQQIAGGDHDTFVCSNDDEAKATVTELLRTWFGWRSVIDLGDLSGARAMEMYLPLWLRLMGALGSPSFNIKVVR
jgi:hypothetical protein